MLPDYASPQAGGTAVGDMTPQWGSTGVVIGYYDSQSNEIFAIYDLAGNLQKELKQENNNLGFLHYLWVNDGQQEYLAIRGTDQWSLYDPKVDKSSAFKGQLEGYSLLAPKGNILRDDGNQSWEFVPTNGQAQALNDCFIDYTKVSIAISPDGEQAACYQPAENVVSIYTKTGLLAQQLPADEIHFLGMSWGPMGWRIAQSAS
jgi:hypothetical protein